MWTDYLVCPANIKLIFGITGRKSVFQITFHVVTLVSGKFCLTCLLQNWYILESSLVPFLSYGLAFCFGLFWLSPCLSFPTIVSTHCLWTWFIQFCLGGMPVFWAWGQVFLLNFWVKLQHPNCCFQSWALWNQFYLFGDQIAHFMVEDVAHILK